MAGKGAPEAPDDLIELGKIVAAYGVKGWVKIQPHSTTSEVLRKAHTWWLAGPVSPAKKNAYALAADQSLNAGTSNSLSLGAKAAFLGTFTKRHVVTARAQGSTLVAQLENLDDRDDAEALAGFTVHVSKTLFPPAKKDEFYWVDLVGCWVYSPEAEEKVDRMALIGIVQEVLDNGAHAILRVQRRRAALADEVLLDPKGRPLELLVPFVAAHVQHVDIREKKIVTDWPLDF